MDYKIDAKKLDRREIETIKRERLREIAKQIKAHEQEEAIIKGRSGKGHKGGKWAQTRKMVMWL